MLAPDHLGFGESARATDDHTQHAVGYWDIGAETAMTMRPTPAVIADARLPFTTAGLLAGREGIVRQHPRAVNEGLAIGVLILSAQVAPVAALVAD
jgi:hypothetical protein